MEQWKHRLKDYFYSGDEERVEGYGSQGWWFTGGASFVSNGYVIYKNGLDGWLPNPTAVLQGRTFNERLLDTRSQDVRSSYAEFIDQLETIAARAALNEEKYLRMKLDQLKKSDIEVSYLGAIESAIKAQDYNAAYTLLLKRQKDLDEFRREINSNKNHSFAKTNEFFNSQFYQYLARKLETQLETQSGNVRSISIDEDFDSFVDGFFRDVMGVSLADNQSLEFIYKQFTDQLKNKFGGDRLVIKWSGFLDPKTKKVIRGKDSTVQFKRSIVSTGKKDAEGHYKSDARFRTPGELARRMAYNLMGGIARGLGQEAYVIGSFGEIGARAFSTGSQTVRREDYFGNIGNPVQGKTDVRAFEVYSSTITLNSVIQDMYADGYEQTMQGFYEELERRLADQAARDEDDEFFQLAVSVKGYVSNFDLSIEGTGSFANRLGIINRLPLAGGMSNKLVFMLNNTTQGCITAGRQDEIADFLAAACTAWMWDENENLFSLENKTPSNYHKIYLFNSGGSYFTASQIIKQTIDRLKNYQNDPNRFVDVTITPPTSYQGYDALMDQYPGTGITSKDEWDAMLKKMWDTVKADAMNSGTIAIHFKQKELDDLLSGLRSILNA